jgi:hypothetical protein
MFMHKRKITALGFLLLMTLPLLFSAGILFKQKMMQLNRRARFEKESLEVIVLPSENIHWVKKGKEILVDGKLFDVKSFTSNNGKIAFTGFFDDEEEELIDRMNEISENREKNNSSASRLFTKFFFSPVYSESAPVSFLNPWHIIRKGFYPYTEVISSGYHPLDIPPPREC